MKIQMKLLLIFLVVLILSITIKIILSMLIATNNNKYNNIKYLLIFILGILFIIKMILLLLMMFYFNTYESLSSDNLELRIPSARGERQIFPKQTIKILIIRLNYTDSFFVKSSTYFLNCLSVDDRLSTVLHACRTVA